VITVIATFVLCCVVLVWTLAPLWVAACDRDPGDGLEKDDRITKWREEKDRLVAEMVSLDLAFTEGKIDQVSYDRERSRVMAEAESAAEQLRKARTGATERKTVPRTYPLVGGALASIVAIGVITLTVILNGHDLRSDANPHANGSIPLTAEQMASGAPGAAPGEALAKPPVGPDGAPDVGAMVAKLETKVKGGGASLDEVMMLARSYRALGREQESLAMYRKAKEIAPDEPQLNLVLASALLRSDNATDRDEAERIVDKTLAEEPAKPEALWLKSLGLIQRHDIEPAKEILGRLKTIVAANSEASTAVAGLLAELSQADTGSRAPGSNIEGEPGAPSDQGGGGASTAPSAPSSPSSVQ